MRFFVLILLIIYTSCTRIKQVPSYSFIHNPVDTSKLQFNGFYNTLDTISLNNDGKKTYKTLTSLNMTIFNKNNRSIVQRGATIDKTPFDCSYYKFLNSSYKKANVNVIGYYTIKGDSLYASLPVYFKTRGMVSKLYNANYRGYVKNRDTITDWKVVPPYPIKIGKFEERFRANSHLLEPQTLYFVKTDAVKCLDMGK